MLNPIHLSIIKANKEWQISKEMNKILNEVEKSKG